MIVPYPDDSQEYAQIFCFWDGFIWLDSGTRREYCSQYDLITASPSQTLSAHSPLDISLKHNGNLQQLSRPEAECWCEQLLSLTPDTTNNIPFVGGALGYIGYEWCHPKFKLGAKNSYQTPLMYLGLYEWALIINHDEKTAYFMFTAELSPELKTKIIDQFNNRKSIPLSERGFHCSEFIPSTERSQYINDVNKILDYIVAGDCYQVNYSQAFTATYTGDPFKAYCQLRKGCPGPFSAFIKTELGAILSLSPEQFIEIDGDSACTRPIKGTATRSEDNDIDQQLAQGLHESDKNRAENLMIVDLLRNDFSQNCRPGSVKVPQLYKLYSFTNVHHLISQIIGTLQANVSSWKFVMDAFPGGSITGAPKKRAMEIIAELEPHQRHIYCGSIGYFSRDGQARTNIAIRTMLIENDQLTLWGGGGVVADSIAEDEFKESNDKIAAFKAILRNSAE